MMVLHDRAAQGGVGFDNPGWECQHPGLREKELWSEIQRNTEKLIFVNLSQR